MLDIAQKILMEVNMKTDRRVKYTQRVLKESLLEILHERPIERVTVKEICDRADVNRSTFYVHYGSPQELFDSIRFDLYEQIKQKKRDYSDIRSYMNEICDIIYENRELFEILIRSGRVETTFSLSELWKNDFVENMAQQGMPPAQTEAAFLYITCGAFAVVITWVLGKFQMSRDEVTDEVIKLTIGALENYFKEDDKNV